MGNDEVLPNDCFIKKTHDNKGNAINDQRIEEIGWDLIEEFNNVACVHYSNEGPSKSKRDLTLSLETLGAGSSQLAEKEGMPMLALNLTNDKKHKGLFHLFWMYFIYLLV